MPSNSEFVLLPSLAGSTHFCLLPDGASGLNYHSKFKTIALCRFTHENYSTGFTMPNFKVIRGAANWNGLCTFRSGKDIFALGLVEESETQMLYLVSFLVDFNNKKLTLVHELFIGIHKLKTNCWANIQRDENGSNRLQRYKHEFVH